MDDRDGSVLTGSRDHIPGIDGALALAPSPQLAPHSTRRPQRSGRTVPVSGAGPRTAAPRVRAAGEGSRSVRVKHELPSVPKIRGTLIEDLQRRGLGAQVIEEAEVVVSELVTNAIRHARPLADGCVRIRWKVKAGAVEIEVSDGGGPTMPRPSRLSQWSVRGRGLRIVRAMAHEWGVQDDKHGRTVWAALGGPSRRRRL